MAAEYDVTKPILILVRRGRGDRGYLVAAVDDAANPFPCADEAEVGKSVIELLDDPAQPRFDERQLEDNYEDEDEDEDLEEEEEDEGEAEDEEPEEEKAPEVDPLDGLGLDPLEKLIFRAGEKILGKARHVSNDYRQKRGARNKRAKKTKKRGKR